MILVDLKEYSVPIYEYVCTQCQHELEALQKLSDAPLKDCPACQQPALKKKISAAGFRLAGSGWYETDFKKGGKQKNLADGSGKESASKDSDKSANASAGSSPKAGQAKKSDGKTSTA